MKKFMVTMIVCACVFAFAGMSLAANTQTAKAHKSHKRCHHSHKKTTVTIIPKRA